MPLPLLKIAYSSCFWGFHLSSTTCTSLSCSVVVELSFISLTPGRKLLKLKSWIQEVFYTPADVCVGKDDLAAGF